MVLKRLAGFAYKVHVLYLDSLQDPKERSRPLSHKLTVQQYGNHDDSSRNRSGMDSNLFFKPIKREIYQNMEGVETDEEKGRRPSLPLKPIPINKPTLYLNDLAFSPTPTIDGSLSSSRLSDGADTPPTAFRDFTLSLEKLRTSSGRKHPRVRAESNSSSRCSSPVSHLRRESEAVLQKLQLQNKAPSIRGMVRPLSIDIRGISTSPHPPLFCLFCCHYTHAFILPFSSSSFSPLSSPSLSPPPAVLFANPTWATPH